MENSIEPAKSITDMKERFPFWKQFTDDQIRNSIKKSIDGLEQMKARAITTGKKQGGYTAEQLQSVIDQYNWILEV